MQRGNMNLKAQLDAIFLEQLSLETQEATESELYRTKGWDSFAHMQLMIAIEEKIGFEDLTPETFSTLSSYKKIFEYLSNATK